MEELCVFDKLIDNFEEAVKGLKAWYDYYKDEEILKPAKALEESNFNEALGRQVASLMTDVSLLRVASSAIMMNNLAKQLRPLE